MKWYIGLMYDGNGNETYTAPFRSTDAAAAFKFLQTHWPQHGPVDVLYQGEEDE